MSLGSKLSSTCIRACDPHDAAGFPEDASEACTLKRPPASILLQDTFTGQWRRCSQTGGALRRSERVRELLALLLPLTEVCLLRRCRLQTVGCPLSSLVARPQRNPAHSVPLALLRSNWAHGRSRCCAAYCAHWRCAGDRLSCEPHAVHGITACQVSLCPVPCKSSTVHGSPWEHMQARARVPLARTCENED